MKKLAVLFFSAMFVLISLTLAASAGVTAADPQAYFGVSTQTEDIDGGRLGQVTCVIYSGVKNDALEAYRQRMEELGFQSADTPGDDGTIMSLLKKDDAYILLIYDPASFSLAVCYQKNMEYVLEAASAIDPIGQMMDALGSAASTQAPPATPVPTKKPEVGYVDVDINGEHHHFSQISSKKTDFVGEPQWLLEFEEVNPVRSDVKATFGLTLDAGFMPGDVLKFTIDSSNSFYYRDRKGTLYNLCFTPSHTIYMDTMDNTGRIFTGRLKGKLEATLTMETVTVTNGTFQFVIHAGDDEEVFY